jgi:glycosyltransferase involved in cell wall biosynthesis
VISNDQARTQLWIALKRTLAHLRTRLRAIRSDGDTEARLQELQRSIDELRASLDGLSNTLTSVGATTDGHQAWLSDLQTWMRSCVQTLSKLADVSPISSARSQAIAPPARRRDEVEGMQRQLHVWTTMTWLENTDVPCDRLISVIMPTRDRSGWIGRAIASVQAQTYTCWELVVVDDGSNDDTALLVAELAVVDERIRSVRIEHAGAPAARNVGLANSTGDIVAYLDDDNVMHPGWLKAVSWAFSCWPQTEVMYGARIIEDDLAHDATRSGSLPSMSFDPWNRRRLEWSNFIDQNVIAHRSELPEAHFDETLSKCQDWDLMLRLTARRRPLELPALACLYSTTAPHRGSDQPDHTDALRRVRARAHVGRPLHLLAVVPHPPDLESGRIDADLASLATEGASVALADGPFASTEADVETETSRLVSAVTEHDPDIVLVYGVDTAVKLAGPLAMVGRPFAVRVTEDDPVAEVDESLRHSLLLGRWDVPERPLPVTTAGFLDQLADSLRAWKLDGSEN